MKQTAWRFLAPVLGALLLLGGCGRAKQPEYPGLDMALHTILDCPQDDLLLLMWQEDNRTELGVGVPAGDTAGSQYNTTLRERLSPYFTDEAMENCIAYVGDYYSQAYLTGQQVKVDGIAYTADPSVAGKVNFTVTVTHTGPDGGAQTLTTDGYAYLDKDGTANTFYLGGDILHELEKTRWDGGELPPLPDGTVPKP